MQYSVSVSIFFSALMCCLEEVYNVCNSDVFSVVNHVAVVGLSVRLSWYPYIDVVTVMRVLLFVWQMCKLRECEGARVTAMLVW